MGKNDGGPAFPIPNATDLDGYVYAAMADGMSLRDYFAGQALAGYMGDPNATVGWDDMAKDCYKVADAMIAARETDK